MGHEAREFKQALAQLAALPQHTAERLRLSVQTYFESRRGFAATTGGLRLPLDLAALW